MPGFRISNLGHRGELRNYSDDRCVASSVDIRDICIERKTLDKFLKDKVWVYEDEAFILFEGVVLNFHSLMKENHCTTYAQTAITLYRKYGINLLNMLDGEVSGAIIDLAKETAYVFTSRLGSSAVFYYANNGSIAIGSQLNYVTDCLRDNNITRNIDVDALKQFMGYGYYLDDSTPLTDVKRLYPGHYLRIALQDYSIENVRYYIADYKQDLIINEDEAIDRLHIAFREAVKKVLSKNEEYSYKTLLDISAGGDSRMIACVAKELGANNVLMDCYAQSNCKDAKTGQQIANMLQYDYVFRSLDNASSLMNIDDNIMMNNGATVYYSITGGKDMLESLDRKMFGLECTGLLGDIFDGSMVVTYSDGVIDKNYRRFRFSDVLEFGTDFTFPSKMETMFHNHVNEHYWFYTRGMIFGMTSYFIRQNFTEVATPYGDPEFLKVYLSLPWDIRVKRHLLRRWFAKYYPEFSAVEYDNTGVSLTESFTRIGRAKRLFIKIIRKLCSFIQEEKPSGMNDYTYWYNHNNVFKDVVVTYYEENKRFAAMNSEIKGLVDRLFNGAVRDKLLAVSVLSIIKQYIAT